MVDAITYEFYDHFIEEQELESKSMVDDDDFNDEMTQCLDNFVCQETNMYDVEHCVNEFGVMDALQLKLERESELFLPYFDEYKTELNKKALYRQLLFVILEAFAFDHGFDKIYIQCERNERFVENEKNKNIDYINNIALQVICF